MTNGAGFKPDFTKDNPYEGVTKAYYELVQDVFVPIPENPKDPVVTWYEDNPDVPPPPFVDITITPKIAKLYYPNIIPPKNVHVTPTPPSLPAILALKGMHKPVWLSNLLDGLNWEFMGVRLYVGDGIERAVDLVFAWLNWLGDLGTQAYIIGSQALQKITEAWDSLTTYINEVSQKLSNSIATWWTDVGDWWETKKVWVSDLVSSATEGFNKLKVDWNNFWTITWPEWTSRLGKVELAWDSFWSITFPELVTLSFLTSWWSQILLDVQGLIDSAFVTRQSLWANWQDWRDKVTEFFTDPEEWLYKAIDRIIERFW